MQNHNDTQEDSPLLEPIAVIGIAGRFPGSPNLEAFWHNLSHGVESISYFSDEEAIAAGTDPELLKNPKFVKAHGLLEGMELFDATFFDMSPRDARILDPQHRIFLECAWEAVENAGYNSYTYPGRIGVYAGTSFSTYLFRNILPNNLVSFPTIDRLEMALTNHKDTMPMRVSFHMNLTGPSICVGTTCSTSLVAIHLACQGLWTYQCDMAMAGASFLRVPPKEGYLFQEGMIYSPDGHLRTFDAKSKGIVTGAGTGVIVIKRMSEALVDGDYIHAIIKATALNNDGSTKVGYTAPSIDGQAEVIVDALNLAGVSSETITFVEAHGTGTELGDPVEVAALQKAFQMTAEDPDHLARQYCAITSTKPNIGHLNHAAGIAGILKAILTLKHRQIPPSINFETPNPKIDFANSPFFVNTQLRDWQVPAGMPRRAGVNAFGIGGTNAHVVMEEAPEREPSSSSRAWQLLLLTAKTATALESVTTRLADSLRQKAYPLADMAYTLQIGRKPLPYRRMALCRDHDDALTVLTGGDPKRLFDGVTTAAKHSVTFMFSGQGAQYVGMGQELYQTEPHFRATLDQCADILLPHLQYDLRKILYPSPEERAQADQLLEQTSYTQPALFAIEYALAQWWLACGVEPKAMVGHSIGEYVAATLAGVFSLEGALALVAARGKMMQAVPPGAMLAVPLSSEALMPLLPEGCSLALYNSSALSVVSGTFAAIDALEQQLGQQGMKVTRLHTSHAFHSAMMEPMTADFAEKMRSVPLQAPKIPYLSNVTGDWITPEQATSVDYWVDHLRQPVRFASNLAQLLKTTDSILLEVGPGRTLGTLAKQHRDANSEHIILASMRHPQEETSDQGFLLTTLGRLWLAGLQPRWEGFYEGERRYRVPLPTYPFERRRYWIDPPKDKSSSQRPQLSLSMLGMLEDAEAETALPIRQNWVAPRNAREEKVAALLKDILGLEQIGIHDHFFELGGSSLLASRVVAELNSQLGQEIVSVAGFLSAPTVAELAAMLPDTGEAQTTSLTTAASPTVTPTYRIKIQEGKSGIAPLFVVHPIDGHVIFYRELAHALGSAQPLYAFQAPGLEGECQPFSQVAQLAEHYLTLLQEIQPQGPYRLGGSSFGGMIAFEMAQLLQRKGESVALLYLADTPEPTETIPAHLADDQAILWFIAKHLLKAEGLDPNAMAGESLEEQIHYCLKQATSSMAGLTEKQLFDWVQVVRCHRDAICAYQPQPYHGKVLFFSTQEPWEGFMNYHPEYYWLDKATQGMEIYKVSGNHQTMNYAPHVQVIARALKRYL